MELEIPLTLSWKQGKDMPFTMTNSIQAVVIDDQVYIGGGYNFDNGRVVMLYTLHILGIGEHFHDMIVCGLVWQQ